MTLFSTNITLFNRAARSPPGQGRRCTREEGRGEEGRGEQGRGGIGPFGGAFGSHLGGHLGAIWELIWRTFSSPLGRFQIPTKIGFLEVICPVRAPQFEPSSGALFHLGFGQKASKFRCSKRGSPPCSGGSSLGRKSSPGSPPHARD